MVTALSFNAPARQKKRVAVLDFDYATVYDGVSAIFGKNEDVGKGIAGLLEDRLGQSGAFIVVDRRAAREILKEQDFGASGRVDPASSARCSAWTH
jgi:curli biogenesis system outer membrane secretion channel CsgG